MPYGVQVDYVAVLVASVVSFILGWLWYGPVFGKLWMKLNQVTQKDIKKAKQKGMAGPMILHFIGTLVSAYVLAIILGAIVVVSVSEALMLVFWIWLGFFAASTLLGSVLWDNKPWGLFVLNGAYWLVNLGVLASIVVLFG